MSYFFIKKIPKMVFFFNFFKEKNKIHSKKNTFRKNEGYVLTNSILKSDSKTESSSNQIKNMQADKYDFKAGATLLVDKPLEWTSFDVVLDMLLDLFMDNLLQHIG